MRPSARAAWHAIPGWLSPAEADTLYRHAAALAAGSCVVEVGFYRGRSTVALALGCKESHAHLTTIDSLEGCPQFGPADIPSDQAVAAALATFGVRLLVDILVERSAAIAESWHAPIDLLFLDGAHDETSVRADLRGWWPRLRPGAVLLAHDYAHGHGDGVVAAVRDELLTPELGELLGICDLLAVVRKHQ